MRIRRVKRTSRGPPPNLRRMGAPPRRETDLQLEWKMKLDAQPEMITTSVVKQRKSADCLEDNSTNCQKGQPFGLLWWQ